MHEVHRHFRTVTAVVLFVAMLNLTACSSSAPTANPSSTSTDAPSTASASDSASNIPLEAEPPNPPSGAVKAKALDPSALDAISSDLTGSPDAQLVQTATTALNDWRPNHYDSAEITTPVIKAAAYEELQALGINPGSSALSYNPQLKVVSLTPGARYTYWIDPVANAGGTIKFFNEDTDARSRLGVPTAENIVQGNNQSTSCKISILIRTGSGKWASVQTDGPTSGPQIVIVRDIGLTAVGMDSNRVGSCAMASE